VNDKDNLSEEERQEKKEFEEFIKRAGSGYVRQEAQKLSRAELKRFQDNWEKEFISYRGRYKTKHIDIQKEADYKFCLFTIIKHHWNEESGFAINMENTGRRIKKAVATVDRMILFFIKCGLLKRVHNYMAGKQSYFYLKNCLLFNYVFRGVVNNDYNNWINSSVINNIDYSGIMINYINKINKEYADTIINNNTNNNKLTINNNINNANVITNKSKRGRKATVYTVNKTLLKKIAKEFLPIVDALNKGRHFDLQIDFGLHFDIKGNYSGRSSSFFCYTLNDRKKHEADNTMEKRSEFLQRMGLSDYKEVYDIKSEVPRTTILANTGKWKSDSYDIYTEIIKESGVEEINREVIKQLYMRFNFDIGTQKEKFNHYRNERYKEIAKVRGIKLNNKSNYRIMRNIYEERLENDVEYTFEEWVELARAIEKIQGKSWGNLIFWWTSMIEIYTIYQIYKETGIRVYNVYDGFYASSKSSITESLIRNTVEKSAVYIYENYIKDFEN
jgi:hypothetical protein